MSEEVMEIELELEIRGRWLAKPRQLRQMRMSGDANLAVGPNIGRSQETDRIEWGNMKKHVTPMVGHMRSDKAASLTV